MTLIIPTWLLYVLGGIGAIAIIGLAVIGAIFLVAMKDFKRNW